MEKLEYVSKVENLLDLADWGMVERSLKFMFENKTIEKFGYGMSSQEKKQWAIVYGKTVQMVESAIREYSNRRN